MTLSSAFCVLAPGAHHERVVDRDAGDRIDALRLELGRLVDIARQMALRAGRGEGARHREQRHLLAAEQLVAGDVLGAFRGHVFECCRGDLVANLDGHRIVPLNCHSPHDRAGARRQRESLTDSIARRARVNAAPWPGGNTGGGRQAGAFFSAAARQAYLEHAIATAHRRLLPASGGPAVEAAMKSLNRPTSRRDAADEDPRFARSVVYLCAHSGDAGAMGLVVNKTDRRADDATSCSRHLKLEPAPAQPPPARCISAGRSIPAAALCCTRADYREEATLGHRRANSR